jgi:hypothetical protein
MSSGYDHRNSHSPIVFRLVRHLLVIFPLHASDARRPSNGSCEMRLLRSGHALRNGCEWSSWCPLVAWARIASTLFEDVMAAMWVQKNARWDGFPSSHLGQLRSPKRDTLQTTFSFFKLPLKFFDQRRKSKSHVPGKHRRRTAARAPWAGRTGPAGLPPFVGRFGPVFCVPL